MTGSPSSASNAGPMWAGNGAIRTTVDSRARTRPCARTCPVHACSIRGSRSPASYGAFPRHTDMAAYLTAYAEAFGLHRLIRFGTTVERIEPGPEGAWRIELDSDSVRHVRAVVVAIGVFWCPKLPEHPGDF